jgi:hypothetical protein
MCVGLQAPGFGHFVIFAVFRSLLMPDHRPEASVELVQLTVGDLPSDVAEKIREAQDQDPDLLRRILLYGITHKVVFETLTEAWRG